ncbi:MAG TPA: MFS transporter [Candidatus Sulfotelmatobacter sp.]|nr:MFS transporter [Candidatus Sulfotelmatobacter sp.]
MHDTTRPEPSRLYRWVVLIFVSLAQAGNYYIYDSINALERIFIDHLGFSATQFGWLNASYSVAAVATLLVGGIIIDRIGTKKSILAFAVICFLGAALTASRGSAPVMIAGRTVLGLGAESMIVAVTTALAKWFRGKELSFAFGINLTIARLASVAADNSPTWANRAFYPDGPTGPPSWQNPLLIAVGAGLFAVVCSIIYWSLESLAEKRYELGKAGTTDKLEFREVFRFDLSYWLVVGLCFTFYSAIFPFRTFAIDLFTNKILAAHGGVLAGEAARVTSLEQAGRLNSLLPLAAMIATPLFGLLVDKVGKRALFMMFGSLLLMPVYLMIAYSPTSLYIPVSMMGIAFSLIPAVMWPSVAYIVDQSRLGTAYALMTLIQQIGFFMLNLLIGKANDYAHAGLDNPNGYALGMWIFSVLGFVGLALALLLRIRETGPHGHGLETITTAHSAATA